MGIAKDVYQSTLYASDSSNGKLLVPGKILYFS